MRNLILAGSICSLLLCACAVGPDYERPKLPELTAYPENKATTGQPVMADWWKGFHDTELDALVAEALKANTDLRIAVARVEEASAGLNEVTGAMLPQVNAGAGASRNTVSNNGYSPITSFAGRDRTSYSGGLSTAFELDFWGKLRRASEAARAQLLSVSEARLQVELALTASVVRTYALVRASDIQLAAAEEIKNIRDEEYRITEERIKVGAASAHDRAQAEVARSAAIAALSDTRRARAQAEHLLGFLVGQPGMVLTVRPLNSLVTPAAPAVGLPSELLRQRPDVVAAEQSLVSANARIGYVKAAYFPTFSLTGALGVESRELSSLFSTGNGTSQFGLNASVPIFDFGRTGARVEAAVAIQHQAAAAYEKAVLNAFREVRDALVDVRETDVAAEAGRRRLLASDEAYRIAEERKGLGQASPAEFLVARRVMAESRVAIARVLLDRLGAQVDLVKALGGARPDARAQR